MVPLPRQGRSGQGGGGLCPLMDDPSMNLVAPSLDKNTCMLTHQKYAHSTTKHERREVKMGARASRVLWAIVLTPQGVP